MPRRGLSVEAQGFKLAIDATRRFSPQLKKVLVRELRGAGEKGAARARGKVLKAHAAGGHTGVRVGGGTPRSGGLRVSLANATAVQVLAGSSRAGVSIVVLESKMPAQYKGLARATDGIGKWRHPVFGTSTYVTQEPFPWFVTTVSDMRAEVREHVVAAMNVALAEAGFRP